MSDSPRVSGRVGVLLAQLGTPDAPTAAAVRRYLRQFLSDPRVIEVPRSIWWAILNLFVLPFRPRVSADRYRRIWSKEHGSPLRHYSERQRELVKNALGPELEVALGMRYGNPSIASALESLLEHGCDRVLMVPLYPQYSASTTGSSCDALFAAAAARRHVPPIRIAPAYHADDGYLEALAARVHEHEATLEVPPEHTLITFHGLPVAMIEKGDPYRDQCRVTAELLAVRLELDDQSWTLTFQSRFGPAEWCKPYTEDRLRELGAAGVGRVRVIAPGFTADCLETIDELGREAQATFRESGGQELSLVPCLNDHPRWIEALAKLVRRETAGWIGYERD